MLNLSSISLIFICISCIFTSSHASSSHSFGKFVSGMNCDCFFILTLKLHMALLTVFVSEYYIFPFKRKGNPEKAIQIKDLLINAQELKEK